MNDPEVNRFILTRPPFTVNQQRKWLRERRKAGDQILAILVPDAINSEYLSFVGVTELRDFNQEKRSALSGSVIGDKSFWKKGIAREARLMQLGLAFNEFGLRWVYSKTISPNLRSQRLLESTGYRLMKVVPRSREVEGQRYNELHYRVSRSGWLQAKKQFMQDSKRAVG